MSTATHYPHIRFDANGKACIGKTRFKISQLAAEHYHYGWSAEELLRQHPELRPGEVYAALTYFYDHFDDLVAAMSAMATEIEKRRLSQNLTRAELLRRSGRTEQSS